MVYITTRKTKARETTIYIGEIPHKQEYKMSQNISEHRMFLHGRLISKQNIVTIRKYINRTPDEANYTITYSDKEILIEDGIIKKINKLKIVRTYKKKYNNQVSSIMFMIL